MLVRGEGFLYLLPHPSLVSYISNYTVTLPRAGMMSDTYTVLPHGSATLVFSRDDSQIRSSFFGPITKPACVGQAANRAGLLFIVEFQPAGYYAFSGMPQKDLTDLMLPFREVNAPLHRLTARLLEGAGSLEDLIAGVDRLFMAHLKASFFQQAFSQANEMIIHSGGLLSVRELSQRTFYSERHLGRMFGQYLGIGVKTFSRIVRVNHALRLMRRPGLSLLQICLQTGYYDMPHFIHEFKSICGVTPQEYRDSMSDFYSEIAKF